MGIYTKFLVCYDVEKDKTRKKLFDSLKDLGLVQIQKSVFYGDLNVADYSAMKRLVNDLLDKSTDKCLWIKCHLLEQDVRACFGYKNFSYTEPDGYDTI